MPLCVVILRFGFIVKGSSFFYPGFYHFCGRGYSKHYLKMWLGEILLVFSENIYYFEFKLYASAIFELHHIRY